MVVGMIKQVGKGLGKDGFDKGFGDMFKDGLEKATNKAAKLKSGAELTWQDYIKNRDKKNQKEFDKSGKFGMGATKTSLKFLKKQTGISMNTSTMLRQSQIFTSSVGAIFQMIGAVIDILLMPLVPLLIPLMKGFAKIAIPMAMQIASWINAIVKGVALLAGPDWGNFIKKGSSFFKIRSKREEIAREEAAERKSATFTYSRTDRDGLLKSYEDMNKESERFWKANKEAMTLISEKVPQYFKAETKAQIERLGLQDVVDKQYDYSRKAIDARGGVGAKTGFFKDNAYQYSPEELAIHGMFNQVGGSGGYQNPMAAIGGFVTGLFTGGDSANDVENFLGNVGNSIKGALPWQ